MAGVTAGRDATPIVALDFSSFDEALELVDLLGDRCRF